VSSPTLPFLECEQIKAGVAVSDILAAVEFYVRKLRFPAGVHLERAADLRRRKLRQPGRRRCVVFANSLRFARLVRQPSLKRKVNVNQSQRLNCAWKGAGFVVDAHPAAEFFRDAIVRDAATNDGGSVRHRPWSFRSFATQANHRNATSPHKAFLANPPILRKRMFRRVALF
jgi:hypothetical protein